MLETTEKEQVHYLKGETPAFFSIEKMRGRINGASFLCIILPPFRNIRCFSFVK
jgi:hypothetical protein